jgi:Beta-galactosidase
MRIFRAFGLACCAALILVSCWGQTTPGMPRLQKQGSATQLIVDGKPLLALAGELANNAATSVDNMKPIWPRIKEAKLNSALVGVSWAQVEPVEGKFDFRGLDWTASFSRPGSMTCAHRD